MRITVGLDLNDTREGVLALTDAGATEFFAGFVPREWSERFGWELGLNRRTYGAQAQYTRIDDLADAMDAARKRGCPFSITLNAHDYGVTRLPLVRDIVRSIDRLEPDSYIVADPALMLTLDSWGIHRPFILSTGIGCYNSESIRFHCSRFPVKRVVFPRKMTLSEMKTLMENVGDLEIEFEAMVIGYRCFFSDEFCFSLHSGSCNNLCTDFVAGESKLSKRFPDNWKEVLETATAYPEEQFRAGSPLDRFRAEIRSGLPSEAHVPDPEESGLDSCLATTFFSNCALCLIRPLMELGVDVLKVPVRGAPWQKQRYLQVVREIAEDPDPSPERCRELIDSSGFCENPQSCYYEMSSVQK